ncbi:MAG: type I restriction enzyme HsdR N-terminal domain-containing protein [Bacteroidales bacterium]|nr:type I restriction enzyme HsdR N-terminal domain-containing protein [Bacteroidales bacterium]
MGFFLRSEPVRLCGSIILNLPTFDIRLRHRSDGSTEVYDTLRRRYVALTPEEWVRQHFVNYLITVFAYPASMMANEVGLRLNGTQRRCDTLVYSRDLRPLAIVEYKRPSVEITSAVFDQIARYNSVIGARWLIVSNGLHHYCCRFEDSRYEFVSAIPRYDAL